MLSPYPDDPEDFDPDADPIPPDDYFDDSGVLDDYED